MVGQLESSGQVEHAFLGITGATIDSNLAQAVNLPVSAGVLVQDVIQGGPADKAGIKGGDTSATIDGASLSLGGDIITAVNGKKVSTMDEVVNIVNAAKPGDTIDVTVLRGGSTKTAHGHPRRPPELDQGSSRRRTAPSGTRTPPSVPSAPAPPAAPTALPFARWTASASRAAVVASFDGRPGHARQRGPETVAVQEGELALAGEADCLGDQL